MAHGEVHESKVKCLSQFIYTGKNTPQWETQTRFLRWHIFHIKLQYHNREFSYSRGITHSCFLRQHIYLLSLSLFFLFIFSFSFSFLPFSFYRHVSCSYLYSYLVANCTIRDIFLYFIGFLPCLILELWLLRVLVLFKLSYMHLMQQKLGENPLINAEEKFSIFLCVLEVSRDYRHLLKATCGLPVHHASSRLASYLFHENWFPVSLFSSLILGMI